VAAEEPPSSTVDVSIPMFEVETLAGEDYVDIPGGDVLLVEGEPRVPYYAVEVELPAGYEVRGVEMVTRSNLSTTEGLDLPIVSMMLDCSCGRQTEAASSANGEEWYPTKDFDWRVVPGADSSTLTIMIYPFFYNRFTTGVRFYQEYSFDIDYTVSTVAVTGLSTDKNTYQQGDTVMVDMELGNSGEVQDVIVDASIKRYGSDETVDGLLFRSLDGLTGTASFSPQWDSAGFEPGYYYVEATIRDSAGNVLDREMKQFRLGICAGEVTTFTATPTLFDIGDTIDVSLVFSNTGTVPATGTAIIQVQDDSGEIVEDFRHAVTNLAPANSITFDDAWDTSGAEEGPYTVVGYVLYDSRTTSIEAITVSTEAYIYLPVILKNYP